MHRLLIDWSVNWPGSIPPSRQASAGVAGRRRGPPLAVPRAEADRPSHVPTSGTGWRSHLPGRRLRARPRGRGARRRRRRYCSSTRRLSDDEPGARRRAAGGRPAGGGPDERGRGPRLPGVRDQEHDPGRRRRRRRRRGRGRARHLPSTGGLEGPAAVTLVDAADWPGGDRRLARWWRSRSARRSWSPTAARSPSSPRRAARARARGLGGDRGQAGLRDRRRGRRPRACEHRRSRARTRPRSPPSVDKLREQLTGTTPEHIVLASSDEPAFAMPAAAWAARCGDPVLFAQRDSVPEPDAGGPRSATRTCPSTCSGPSRRSPTKAFDAIEKVARERRADRRRRSGRERDRVRPLHRREFGWNINDPGHGFVIANAERPPDAGAAAPLSASGTWGPLLLTDDPPSSRGRCAATCSTSSPATRTTRRAPSTTTSG